MKLTWAPNIVYGFILEHDTQVMPSAQDISCSIQEIPLYHDEFARPTCLRADL